MSAANPLLVAALDYASRGWPVFPCDPRTKRPLLPRDADAEGNPIKNSGGVKKASIDPSQIGQWWQKWPRAMIAVAVGEAGLLVIDFDPRTDLIVDDAGEVVGDEEWTLDRLKTALSDAAGTSLPATLISITRSGGEHHWFKMPPGASIGNVGSLPKHIDVRGAGGYVIVPPSHYDGNDGDKAGDYRWLENCDVSRIANLPTELLDLMKPKVQAGRSAEISYTATHFQNDCDEAHRRYAMNALDREIAELAATPKGGGRYNGRNQGAYHAAFNLGQFVGAGALTETIVRVSLLEVVRGFDPAAYESHSAAISNGLENGRQKPRDLSSVGLSSRRTSMPHQVKADTSFAAGDHDWEQDDTTHRFVASYPYVDGAGTHLFEVIRYEPKLFRNRRPDGKGGYLWNVKGVEHPLYRLPDVSRAIRENERIYIVEGEADADRLASVGLCATCNPGGSGKWSRRHTEALNGARVAIIPDNDDPGVEHAEFVARALNGVAANVKLLALDNQGRKDDVSDWMARGGTAEQLVEITSNAADWRPTFKPRFPMVWFGQEDSAAPLSWLVRGLIVESGVSVVYGPPKSSKTFVTLDLALSVAHGRDWYGLRVKAGGVVYVCGEGAAGVRQRMKAWRKEKSGDPSAPFALVPQSINLFDGEDDLDRLIADIKSVAEPMGGPVRLVILDTLSRMIGSGDEDKARDINVVVRSAERIQREAGAHVMIVHHSGKDRDRGMRGSNALLGAVDAAIEVTKGETGLCEARVTAIKDGGEVGPFTYTLKQSTVGVDAEGDEIVSCVIDPAGASQAGERNHAHRLSDADQHALDELQKLIRDMGTGRDNRIVVPVGTWRDRIYSSTDGSHEAKRKRAYRSVNSLKKAGIIGADDDIAWLVRGV